MRRRLLNMLGMGKDTMNITMTNKELSLDRSIDLAYNNALIWAQADEYTGGTTVNFIEALIVNGEAYPVIVGYTGRGSLIMNDPTVEDGKLGFTFNASLGNWKICQIEIPTEYLPDIAKTVVQRRS